MAVSHILCFAGGRYLIIRTPKIAEISFRLPHQGRTAAGADVFAACLAGAFVALAGVASTAAAATVDDPSLAKLVSGCVFPAGLAMSSWPEASSSPATISWSWAFWLARSRCGQMLRNWLVVLSEPFGAQCSLRRCECRGPFFRVRRQARGVRCRHRANVRRGLSFGDAFVRGICNFLVCIAVWWPMPPPSA